MPLIELQRKCPMCNSQYGSVIHSFDTIYFDDCPLPLKRELVTCSECSFLFSNAEYTEEKLNEYYSSYYSGVSYNAIPITSHYLTTRKMSIVDVVLPYIDKSKNKLDVTICDIGCGSGNLLAEFYKKGFTNVLGVDTADVDSISVEGRSIPIQKEDLYNFTLNYKPEVILSTGVLEHLLHPKKALEIAYENLEQGGILYVEVPDAAKADQQSFILSTTTVEHINFFTQVQLQKLLHEIGFSVFDVRLFTTENTQKIDSIGIVASKGVKKAEFEMSTQLDAQKLKNEISSITYSIDQDLIEFVNTDRPVYIWGITPVVGTIWEHSSMSQCSIRAVVDKSEKKQGQYINGLCVQSPEILIDAPDDSAVIIGAIIREESVIEELERIGYNGKIIRNICVG